MNKESIEQAICFAQEKTALWLETYRPIRQANHRKVQEGFAALRVSETCFHGSTGYGYGDRGRDVLDALWARVFRAEDALVRTQLVSGTHTLHVALSGLLRPGELLVSATGAPYDTLQEAIGIAGTGRGSLLELGVRYEEIDHNLDPVTKGRRLPADARLILIQRSRGYSWRPCLTICQIAELIEALRQKAPDALILVDNCYGEFTEAKEPLEAGADLIAGSLIKNPGGGLAPTGGYVAGRKDLVEQISYRLTAPGIGREVGSSSGTVQRLLYQGLYMAPLMTAQALEGAVFTAALMERLGYPVSPAWDESRSGIVQAIRFPDSAQLIRFCQAIQRHSPVDAHVTPEAWNMPGYEDPVIMAAGTFVGGATSELSADAPIREPYTVYLQGGLSADYVKDAVQAAVENILLS